MFPKEKVTPPDLRGLPLLAASAQAGLMFQVMVAHPTVWSHHQAIGCVIINLQHQSDPESMSTKESSKPPSHGNYVLITVYRGML